MVSRPDDSMALRNRNALGAVSKLRNLKEITTILTVALAFLGADLKAQLLSEDFESDAPGWTIEGGVWEIGAPDFEDGPESARAGDGVAGTNLTGDYPNRVDARLITPQFLAPEAEEFPRFVYWNWYETAFESHYGHLQIRTDGGAWVDLDERVESRSGDGGWVQRIVDLRPYAGQNVEIAFHFLTTTSTRAAGWYIDDASVQTGPMTFASLQDFETSLGDWSVENGVWQWGAPSGADGPPNARSGSKVMGTILSGDYPNDANARLVSPEFHVPSADEFPRFVYWNWYETAFDSHFGQLQIRTHGGEWSNIEESVKERSGSGGWVQRIVDLRSFADQDVQIGFQLVTTSSTRAPGWYIDDVSLETGPMTLQAVQDFEETFGDWSVENGVWQWGAPTGPDGPARAHSGTSVVGTILSGDYPNRADARLVSPEFLVPNAEENPRFRYWYWYETAFSSHFAQVQISVDGAEWRNYSDQTVHQNLGGGAWAQRILDLKPYAGQNVRIGFRLRTTTSSTASGLYIDDARLETGPTSFEESPGFENGFGDWSAEGGVWQVGAPTGDSGPSSAFEGESLAATVLNGDYPNNIDARLVSPRFEVPDASENPRVRYWNWYSTAFNTHFGQLQVRIDDGEWTDIESERVYLDSLGWSQRIVYLGEYAGQSVQLGFHFQTTTSTTRAGWYIDEPTLETGPLTWPNPDGFENGFGDWSAEGGLWQVGAPTGEDGPASANTGASVAGTVLAGDYHNRATSRLVSPPIIVPSESSNPVLKFSHWIATPFSTHNGRVQIRVAGSEWTDISDTFFGLDNTNWRDQSIDLSPYADRPVQIAFLFNSTTSLTNAGWYLDDISIQSDSLDPIENLSINELEELRVPLSTRVPNPRFELINGFAMQGATIEANPNTLIWVPGEDVGPGNLQDLEIWLTQPNNALTPIARDAFSIQIYEINTAPSIDSADSITVDEQTGASIPVAIADMDIPENSVSVELVSGPEGAEYDPTSQAVIWTPNEAQGPGTHTVAIAATDSNPVAVNATRLTTTREIQIAVQETNRAPAISPISDQITAEGEELLISTIAADPDLPANDLLFSLSEAPDGATIDPATGVILWTPGETFGGKQETFSVTVTDNGVNPPALSASANFSVTVTEVNATPQLTVPGAPMDATEGEPIQIQMNVEDGDIPENEFQFFLESAPESMNIDPASGLIQWTPSEDFGGQTITVTVEVADDGEPSRQSSQSFEIVVQEVNESPVLAPIADTSLNELESFQIALSATDSDVPANTLSYSLVDAPEGMTLNETTGALAWTPSESQGPGEFPITVRVDDNGVPPGFATESFTISANEVNAAPVIAPIDDFSHRFGADFSLAIHGADPDIPVNELTYSLDIGPSGMTIDPVSGELSWEPLERQIGSAVLVSVRVSDNQDPALEDTTSFRVTVTESAPSLSIAIVDDEVQLTIDGETDQDYVLEIAESVAANWTSLFEFRLQTSPFTIADPDPIDPEASRFYRLRQLPAN